MLEPQAENPRQLLDHHRRHAALHYEAGDLKAAYWHGRKAQAALKKGIEEEEAGRKPTDAEWIAALERMNIAVQRAEQTCSQREGA